MSVSGDDSVPDVPPVPECETHRVDVPDVPPVPECETHRVDGLDLEHLADLVADRVLARLPSTPAASAPTVPLAWTATEVAAEVGRSVDWVREHRHELGLIPASGVRPRLMFDPVAVRAWATARDGRVRSVAVDPAPAVASTSRRRSRTRTAADLIPIRGDRRAA